MKIGFAPQQSSFTQSQRINQSGAVGNGNNRAGQLTARTRMDRVTISAQGKKNSLLESLMKQKTHITEQKNALIGATLEKGDTLSSIKSQLENYDEQMKNIDDQVAEMMAKEMEKQTEKLEKQEDDTPKTEEELQNQRLANLTSLSGDLQQAKTIRSVQARVDGDARVLESEIKLDKARASTPGTAQLVAKKEVKLEGMEQRSFGLTSEIADRLTDVSQAVVDSHNPQVILPQEEATVQHPSKAENPEKSPEENEQQIID